LRRAIGVIAVLLLVGLVLGQAGPAWAGTRNVSMQDFSFDPAHIAPSMGVTVHWTNDGAVDHTSTADTKLPNGKTGLDLWDSGTVAPGGEFSFDLPWAASFTNHCTFHAGMTGRVAIAPKIVHLADDQGGLRYRVRWASRAAPTGLRFQVQIKKPGDDEVFTDWRNTTALYSVIHPHHDGTYAFRFRLVQQHQGVVLASTMWSPAASVTVELESLSA
jgi:plastocyanin